MGEVHEPPEESPERASRLHAMASLVRHEVQGTAAAIGVFLGSGIEIARPIPLILLAGAGAYAVAGALSWPRMEERAEAMDRNLDNRGDI